MAVSPRTTKGALVRLDGGPDPKSGDAFVFQFNPETLDRRVDQNAGGLPREVVTFALALDAIDAMEAPDSSPAISRHGVYPALAALELLMYPSELGPPSWVERFLGIGSAATEQPLALFMWGNQRAIPVRLTRLSISEEQHDPRLVPIRATVHVRLQVVTGHDLPNNEQIGELWRRHLLSMRDVAKLGYTKLQ